MMYATVSTGVGQGRRSGQSTMKEGRPTGSTVRELLSHNDSGLVHAVAVLSTIPVG